MYRSIQMAFIIHNPRFDHKSTIKALILRNCFRVCQAIIDEIYSKHEIKVQNVHFLGCNFSLVLQPTCKQFPTHDSALLLMIREGKKGKD